MNYYSIAILNSPLNPLTYHSEDVLKRGERVFVSLHHRKDLLGVVVEQTDKPSFKTVAISSKTPFYHDTKQLKLAQFLSNYYFCSLGEAFGIMTPYSDEQEKESFEYESSCTIKLSSLQTDALAFIQKEQTTLLFGDTGSGKTEIYMKLFDEMLQKKKRALFLLPEISLTPQMQKRLQAQFGQSVVMWHSRLTKKQKEKALHSIYSGEAKIVAGARSALFLPLHDLGVIVVDEEHDDSYKSSARPRYHARDVAIYMGKLYNAKVVLGSATPTLSSYEKFPTFRLKGGHYKTKRTFVYEPSLEQITPFIIQELQTCLKNKEQALVFVPTRANFKYLMCEDCGEGFECSFCQVGMSIHRRYNALKCHYCGFTQPIPKVCPKCGADTLKSSRLGTVEAIEELQKALGKDVVIEQFDRDSITTQAKLKKILKRFNDKEIDILVGTQMLTKGHDYHDVTLAVVLGLDNMLGLSDYRARERALSTLIQIAGRSGRKKDAKVIVQSYHEEFFESYKEHFETFLEEEKEYRKELYPPYMRLARVLFAHKNGQKAKAQMEKMLTNLQQFQSLVQIVGYGECSVAKISGKYRF